MSEVLGTEVAILKANQKELQDDVAEIKLKLHEYELERVRTEYANKEEIKQHVTEMFDKIVLLISEQNDTQDKKRDKHIHDQGKINEELRQEIQTLKDKPMVEWFEKKQKAKDIFFINVANKGSIIIIVFLIGLFSVGTVIEIFKIIYNR